MSIVYDAVILANGEIPDPKIWQDIQYATLICTDGAAIALKDKLMPDIIIGDLDSTSIEFLEENFSFSKVYQVHDQDTTDLEKAFNFVKQQKFKRVLCIGAMGKFADHSMHNLTLLSQNHPFDLTFLHCAQNIRQWIFKLSLETHITCPKRSLVSFFPFPHATLTTQGLQWELQNLEIVQGQKSAVRNVTLQETVSIHCQGNCLIFLTAPEFQING